MEGDLLLIGGLTAGLLALPSAIGAYSDGRAPRMAIFWLALCGGMLAGAFWLRPGGYAFDDVPGAFFRVFARVMSAF